MSFFSRFTYLFGSLVFRTILIVLLLISSISLHYSIQHINGEASGYEDSHVDQPMGASVLNVIGHNPLLQDSKELVSYNRFMNNVYKHHYSATNLLERDIEITNFSTNNNSGLYSMTITFLPSQTKYSASIVTKEGEASIERVNQ